MDKTIKKTVLEGLAEGFIYQPADYYPKQLIATYNGNLKHGDKVKLIIIREEEDENKDS